MSWSETAMKESFYFSNMSPQDPSFNRGIWKKLEAQLRSWAIVYDSIYIVTGPILTDGLEAIGPNEVSIPQLYYKAVIDLREDRKEGIAFLLKNEASQDAVQSFAISIDSLERVSGLELYPFLDDALEAKIESEICISCWDWSIHTVEARPASTTKSSTTQCLGKNKIG